MKKILTMIILSLIFALSSCDSDEEVEVIECTGNKELVDGICQDKVDIGSFLGTKLNAMVPDGFEYTVTNSQEQSFKLEKYFTVNFTSLSYSPVEGEVCVQFQVEDDDYEHANYYIILQKSNSILTLQQYSFSMNSSANSNGGCFDAITGEETYKILVGKIDEDDLNPTSYIESVAFVSFSDTHFNDRNRIEEISLTHDDIEDETNGEDPSVNYHIRLQDNNAISKVNIGLYEMDYGYLIETKEYIITENERDSNGILLNDVLFDNLAPGVDYKIEIEVTGNDGFDDFSNLNIAKDDFTSGCYNWRCGTAYVEMYAGIINVEVLETEVLVTYTAHNTGVLVSTSDNLPYTMNLVIRDKDHHIKYTIPLDITSVSISLPVEYVNYWDYITIVSDRDGITFATYEVIENPPLVTLVSVIYGNANITIEGNPESINFITIEFLQEENNFQDTAVAEVTNPTENSYRININRYDNIRGLKTVYVFINISYETSNGTKLFQKREQIDLIELTWD